VGRNRVADRIVDEPGGREAHFRDFWSLSSDGQTLIMEHRDDDLAGQITFLEKAYREGELGSGGAALGSASR
jgi:hypothetical protein